MLRSTVGTQVHCGKVRPHMEVACHLIVAQLLAASSSRNFHIVLHLSPQLLQSLHNYTAPLLAGKEFPLQPSTLGIEVLPVQHSINWIMTGHLV